MIEIRFCGGKRMRVTAGLPPRVSQHDDHVLGLHVVRSGAARYGCEAVTVRGPFIAVLPAGERDENGMTGDMDSMWCLFRGESVRGTDGSAVELCWGDQSIRRPHTRPLTPVEVRTGRLAMGRLAEAHRQPGPAGQMSATGQLLELLALWASPANADRVGDPVAEFRARIEERAEDPTCSLETLAEGCGLHSDWLRRRFAACYGMSPVAYRNRLRLEHARELLQTTGKPVGEVAELTGYSSLSHFCRAFRKQFGMKPGDLSRLDRG
jgi:AraC-like DNA-binding protein